MSIIAQAEAELERVQFGDGDTAVMLGILRTFLGQWDSGGAVSVASEVLMRLIAGQPLTPLTGEPGEWRDPLGDGEMLQNVRCATVVKMRNGAVWDTAGPDTVAVEFPYNPVTRRVEMPIYEVPIGDADREAQERAACDALAGGVGITRIDPRDYFEPIGDAAARVVDKLRPDFEWDHGKAAGDVSKPD